MAPVYGLSHHRLLALNWFYLPQNDEPQFGPLPLLGTSFARAGLISPSGRPTRSSLALVWIFLKNVF
jgi:hypothetical protein